MARYQSPPTRATTILNQLLYIVFYSVYIGVKIRLSSPATEWATVPQGECSRITTVTLPRTSRLRHLNHLRPHLFFFVSSVMFTRFSPTHRTHPPFAVFVFSSYSKLSLAQTKQHFEFEQTAVHQHAAAAAPAVCAALCTGNLQTIVFIAQVWVPMQ